MRGYQARPYQDRMTQAILEKNVFLAAPPGLGKTSASLAALDALLGWGRRKALVVAPKVVACDTWPNEIEKWSFSPPYRVWKAEDFDFGVSEVIIEGVSVGRKLRPRDKDALREEILSDPAPLHIVSRDNFYNFVLALGKAWPYGTLVLDESYSFSDITSGRFRAVKAVRPYTDRIVLLNGTPVGNGLEKLWAQMLLVDGGAALGRAKGAFLRNYMTPTSTDRDNPLKVYSWGPKLDAVERVVAACRGSLITMLEKDWLNLPPFVVMPVGVEIPMEDYRRMERESLLELGPEAYAVAVNAGVLYNKLSQIACGVCYDTEQDWHEVHRVKIDALLDIAEEHTGPLLIWTSFQPDAERIKKALPGARLAREVKNLEKEWNAGRIQYLIAHPESLSFGANLQDCPGSGMVWFGVTGNHVHWTQGIKRLFRGGRREPVPCYVIYAKGTVEEDKMRSRADRGVVEDAVMEGLAHGV